MTFDKTVIIPSGCGLTLTVLVNNISARFKNQVFPTVLCDATLTVYTAFFVPRIHVLWDSMSTPEVLVALPVLMLATLVHKYLIKELSALYSSSWKSR